MPESKHATPPGFAEVGSDLAMVDAHVIQPEEYDELPELTDAMIDRADFLVGGKLVRRGRGRPKLDAPKRQVTLRLDADLLDHFRASGPGWQARVNAILRNAMDRSA